MARWVVRGKWAARTTPEVRLHPPAPAAWMQRGAQSPAHPEVATPRQAPSTCAGSLVPCASSLASPSWLCVSRLSSLFPSCFLLTLVQLLNLFHSLPSTCLIPPLDPFLVFTFLIPLAPWALHILPLAFRSSSYTSLLPPSSSSLVPLFCVCMCVLLSFPLSLANPHTTSPHCPCDPTPLTPWLPHGLVLPRTDSCLTPYPC